MKKQIAAIAVVLTAAFVVIRAQDASNPADLIKSAEAAVRRADYSTADTLYAKAASGPDRAEIAPALLYLGIRALGTGNHLAAEGFFERVVKIDPKGPQAGPALSWLAQLQIKTDVPRAEQLFKQAMDAESPTSLEYVETLRKYSLLLRKLSRFDEARELEERASQAQIGTRRPSTAALPAGVFKAGGDVTPPSLLYKTEPQYTEGARSGAVQGTTVLGVDIQPDGTATNFEIIRSLEPGLDQKAVEAVQQWKFKPGTKDGQPVTVRATIEVNFRLM